MPEDFAQGQAQPTNYGGYSGAVPTGGPGGEPLYYYTRNGTTAGPVPMGQLIQLAGSGWLGRDELVWIDGDATSTAAWQVPALAQVYQQQPLDYRTASQPVISYATFWQRFAAFILDTIITVVANVIVGAVLGGIAGGIMGAMGGFTANDIAQVGQGIGGIAGLILPWLYYAIFESSSARATPGKMALGLVVVDEQVRRIGFGRATGRHFGKILSGIILAIGYLMVLWTQRRQGLHDILAGTLVITK